MGAGDMGAGGHGSGGGIRDRVICPRLPVRRYHLVLARKGLRTNNKQDEGYFNFNTACQVCWSTAKETHIFAPLSSKVSTNIFYSVR